MAKSTLGEQKKGDLAFLRVYKFKMNKQLTLLGYRFDGEMLALGSHENFYQDIKYNIQSCNADKRRQNGRNECTKSGT